MPDSLYQNHVENESLTWICSECGMPQFWNLSSSLFGSTAATDTFDSAHNTPSATSHNTDTTTEEISVSSALTPDRQLPSATSTPVATAPQVCWTDTITSSQPPK